MITNTYVGIIDEEGRRIWKKKLRNDPSLISATLSPLKEDIEGIVGVLFKPSLRQGVRTSI